MTAQLLYIQCNHGTVLIIIFPPIIQAIITAQPQVLPIGGEGRGREGKESDPDGPTSCRMLLWRTGVIVSHLAALSTAMQNSER